MLFRRVPYNDHDKSWCNILAIFLPTSLKPDILNILNLSVYLSNGIQAILCTLNTVIYHITDHRLRPVLTRCSLLFSGFSSRPFPLQIPYRHLSCFCIFLNKHNPAWGEMNKGHSGVTTNLAVVWATQVKMLKRVLYEFPWDSFLSEAKDILLQVKLGCMLSAPLSLLHILASSLLFSSVYRTHVSSLCSLPGHGRMKTLRHSHHSLSCCPLDSCKGGY